MNRADRPAAVSGKTRQAMSELNVLHVIPTSSGGAGQAGYRLHMGLKRLGVSSRVLTASKVAESDDVRQFRRRSIWRQLDRVSTKVSHLLSLPNLFYPSTLPLIRDPWFRKANVLQLSYLQGFFSYPILTFLSNLRPLVWRLDDMWALTGGCSYSYDCHRWRTGCGSCPLWVGRMDGAPRSSEYVNLPRDSTALLWRIKKWVYRRSRFNIVAPSRWMASVAQESPLLDHSPIHVIPYGLDTEVFRPVQKASARDELGIEPDRRVILFSAHRIDSPRKGGAMFKQALNSLDHSSTPGVSLLIVGTNAEKWGAGLGFPAKCMSFVDNDRMMATAYSAADLLVVPTLADNLPNSILESMACGTPVVSFDVGGVPELVRHMETGYLAAYKDAGDLANGIRLLLDDPGLSARMGQRCREVVEREHSLDLQATRYLDLYNDLMQRSRSAG